MLAAAGRAAEGVISVVTKSPVTIRDVARLAGVSVGTVSKALNGYGQLRAETRDAVRNAAERLGFRPNDLAQSLLRKRSFTVGLISTDSYGRFSIPVLEGIERRPRARASLGLPVHAPTTRCASASTSIPCWPSASTASSSPAAAPTGVRRSISAVRRCRSSMPSPRSPILGRSACCPTTAAAPGLPSSI